MKKTLFIVGGLALGLAVFAVSASSVSAAISITDNITPQNCARRDAACAFFLDTTSEGQIKWGGLVAGGLRSLSNLFVDGKMGVGTLAPSVGQKALRLDVEGAVGAQFYCDANGNNCIAGDQLGQGGGGGDSLWVTSTQNANNIYNRNSGNVGIGINNPTAKLDVNGSMKIEGNNALEFGAGIGGKQSEAGKIGYHIFPALTLNSLDIVGAGSAIGDRLVRVFDDLKVEDAITSNSVTANTICTTNGVCKTVANILNASSTVIGGVDSWTTAGANIYRLNGNVGFGTANPIAKLDLVGTLRIADGTEGVNKVLTSDANGKASWRDMGDILDSCVKIASTETSASPVTVTVPSTCLANGEEVEDAGCTLKQLAYKTVGGTVLRKTRVIEYSQDIATGKWWSNYRLSGTRKNGDATKQGITRCAVLSGGVCYLGFYDDAAGERDKTKWTLIDNAKNWYQDIYLCSADDAL